MRIAPVATLLLFAAGCTADEGLRRGLTFHAPFDGKFDAALSADDSACRVRAGGKLAPAAPGPDLRLAEGGRFGGCLVFPKKGSTRPEFAATKSLAYGTTSWSATVSVWLKLNPDKDLEPGYCDPVQIVGDDVKKGFIFLEWSKDHAPRHFRFAVRPLFHIWNPDAVGWEQIADERRPMVKMEKAPFAADRWTHVVFVLDRINDHAAPPKARLHVDGRPVGVIRGHDLTFGWDPAAVRLVLGAAYVGALDEFAAWNRALSDEEIARLHALPGGVDSLRR
ncbi:MAG: LamG domain-containing protein [Verrucomicrobia bacterium]|nr:LamG domain-containing protein [Verrucomicrobiota bacterium]